ncbi:MAG: IS3 family transposase [Proteobacteria bacterium]|nr:IS3 family transposase [Pseudomonadota bacterium]
MVGGRIDILCSIANVSRSGYYRWLKQADEVDKDNDDYLLVKKIFDKGKKKFGWRAVQMHLKEDLNIVMNHKKIIRIKNKYGLITKIRKVNPYKAIMKKTKEHRTFENILNREFKQDNPFKVFCTDITYIPYNNRMAYLSVVKDIASKEIVSWTLSMHLTMDIVLDTIKNMKNNIQIPSLKSILIHSDQGVHYTNPEYISGIKELNMIQSMSRKGNCIDNAPIESFFGHFKDDVDYKICKTFEELKKMISEYMEYYNNKRYQWDLKKMTPVQYRNHLLSTA